MKMQSWNKRRLLLAVIAILMLSVTSISSSFAQDDEGEEEMPLLPQQSYLPLELALTGASAALSACEAEGYGVSVTIVDAGGVQKVHLRADGAGPHTIGSSAGKAWRPA